MTELKLNDIIKIKYINSYIYMGDLKAKITRDAPRDIWTWVFEWLDDPATPVCRNADYLELMAALGYNTGDMWLWSTFCGEIAETITDLCDSDIKDWSIFECLEFIRIGGVI